MYDKTALCLLSDYDDFGQILNRLFAFYDVSKAWYYSPYAKRF